MQKKRVEEKEKIVQKKKEKSWSRRELNWEPNL